MKKTKHDIEKMLWDLHREVIGGDDGSEDTPLRIGITYYPLVEGPFEHKIRVRVTLPSEFNVELQSADNHTRVVSALEQVLRELKGSSAKAASVSGTKKKIRTKK